MPRNYLFLSVLMSKIVSEAIVDSSVNITAEQMSISLHTIVVDDGVYLKGANDVNLSVLLGIVYRWFQGWL